MTKFEARREAYAISGRLIMAHLTGDRGAAFEGMQAQMIDAELERIADAMRAAAEAMGESAECGQETSDV